MYVCVLGGGCLCEVKVPVRSPFQSMCAGSLVGRECLEMVGYGYAGCVHSSVWGCM